MTGRARFTALALALAGGAASACAADRAAAPDDGPRGRGGNGNNNSSDGASPGDGAVEGCVEEPGQGALGAGEPVSRCICDGKTYSPLSSTVAPGETYAVTRTRLPLARLVVCALEQSECSWSGLCDAGCFDPDAGFLKVVRMLFPGPLGEALTADVALGTDERILVEDGVSRTLPAVGPGDVEAYFRTWWDAPFDARFEPIVGAMVARWDDVQQAVRDVVLPKLGVVPTGDPGTDARALVKAVFHDYRRAIARERGYAQPIYIGAAAAADLRDVPRPSDLGSERLAGLDADTYTVELTVPESRTIGAVIGGDLAWGLYRAIESFDRTVFDEHFRPCVLAGSGAFADVVLECAAREAPSQLGLMLRYHPRHLTRCEPGVAGCPEHGVMLRRPAETARLRGWLIRSRVPLPGVAGGCPSGALETDCDAGRPLVVLTTSEDLSFAGPTAIGSAFRLPRDLAYALVGRGYDVVYYDYAGTGLSEGLSHVVHFVRGGVPLPLFRIGLVRDPLLELAPVLPTPSPGAVETAETVTEPYDVGNAVNVLHVARQLAEGTALAYNPARGHQAAVSGVRLVAPGSPIVLYGLTQGAGMSMLAMRLAQEVNDPIDERIGGVPAFDYASLNLVGVVQHGGATTVEHSTYVYRAGSSATAGLLGRSLHAGLRHIELGDDGAGLAAVSRFPAWLGIKGIHGAQPVDGDVATFNAARGLKRLVTAFGKGVTSLSGGNLEAISKEAGDFIAAAVARDPQAPPDTRSLTFDEAICAAPYTDVDTLLP